MDKNSSHDSVMVSVIVLTYNHEKYISQALDSILMQKVDFQYEILVGDDASTDRTPQILRDYQRRYPKIIRLFLREENVGPTKNAYELFYEARGKYLAACEGDDYWTSSKKLETQIKFLEDHEDFIGCAHDCLIVDERGCAYAKQRLPWVSRKTVYTLKDFHGIMLPGQAATLVRRNIYRENRYDYSVFYKAHSFIGDRTTALIYTAQGNFYHFPSCMSCYRRTRRESNLTNRIFSGYVNGVAEDLRYTEALEEYAVKTLKVNVNFRSHKADLFVSAMYYFLKDRNSDAVAIMKQLWRTERRKWVLILYIPVGVCKKIMYRCFFFY